MDLRRYVLQCIAHLFDRADDENFGYRLCVKQSVEHVPQKRTSVNVQERFILPLNRARWITVRPGEDNCIDLM
jgi:hypothetical protein